MAEGDGDCDTDADCADGLLCGSANCGDFYKTDYWPYDSSYGGWDHVDDCCYAPVEQVAPLHFRPQPRPYCECLTLFSCGCSPHPPLRVARVGRVARCTSPDAGPNIVAAGGRLLAPPGLHL